MMSIALQDDLPELFPQTLTNPSTTRYSCTCCYPILTHPAHDGRRNPYAAHWLAPVCYVLLMATGVRPAKHVQHSSPIISFPR